MRGAFEVYYMRREYADSFRHWLFEFCRPTSSTTLVRVCGLSFCVAVFPLNDVRWRKVL